MALFDIASILFGKNSSKGTIPREVQAKLDEAKTEFARINGLPREVVFRVYSQLEALGAQGAMETYSALINNGLKYERHIREILKQGPWIPSDSRYGDLEHDIRMYLQPSTADSEKPFTDLLSDAVYVRNKVDQMILHSMPKAYRKKNTPDSEMYGALRTQLLATVWMEDFEDLRTSADVMLEIVKDHYTTATERRAQKMREKNLANLRQKPVIVNPHLERKKRKFNSLLGIEKGDEQQQKAKPIEVQAAELRQVLNQIKTENKAFVQLTENLTADTELLFQAIEKEEIVNSQWEELLNLTLQEVRALDAAKSKLISEIQQMSGDITAFVNDEKTQNLLLDYTGKSFSGFTRERGRRSVDDVNGYNLESYNADDAQVRELLAEISIAKGEAQLKADIQRNAHDSNASAKRQLAQLELESSRKEKRVNILTTLSGEFREEIAELRSMLHDLSEVALDATVDQSQYPPLSLLSEWVKANLNGRVVIASSAFKKAAKSEYAHPEHIYQALELLANEYWEQKTSAGREETPELRKKFNEKMDSLYLDIGKSLTRHDDKIRQAYEVNYDGKKYFLDQHLGRGSARDPHRCLRIYFTWLEDKKQVLVGHLPEHLPNFMS